MTRSMLSRLPDIFASAAVRSSETMHALGRRPGQCVRAANAAFEPMAAPRCRLHLCEELPALMGMLAGTAPFSLMGQQLGLLWLSTLPSLHAPFDASDPEALQKCHTALLADFAHRLLLARELLSPSALVVVECAPGLEEGVSLVMQTVFGQRPQWTQLDERVGAPSVLVCAVGAVRSAGATLGGLHQRHRTHLLQWLREVPMEHRTALALGPHLDLDTLWRAWRGRWVVAHADPVVFEQLRLQFAERLGG